MFCNPMPSLSSLLNFALRLLLTNNHCPSVYTFISKGVSKETALCFTAFSASNYKDRGGK